MFESWVSERKNVHLRNALLLRKACDYPNALKELQIAVNEGDMEAQWVMWNAYDNGGFGLYKDHIKRDKYPKPEWSEDDKRNPEITGDAYYILYAAICGNAYFQWIIGKCENGWTYKACDQHHRIAVMQVCLCYRRECSLCTDRYNVLEIAHIIANEKLWESMYYALQTARNPELRLQELYIYGKFLSKESWEEVDIQEKDIAKRIYSETTEKSQKAVLCWLLISKQFLVPDLRRLIGQMVWESRTRPEEWITRENNNKKLKNV